MEDRLDRSPQNDPDLWSGVNMEFGGALVCLRTRRKVARRGWNGRAQWLQIQSPDENSKMSLPYVFIRTVQGDLVPWVASQTDLLATDWFCVD